MLRLIAKLPTKTCYFVIVIVTFIRHQIMRLEVQKLRAGITRFSLRNIQYQLFAIKWNGYNTQQAEFDSYNC